jgi:Flp pilus assembly protein TadG
MIAHLLATVRRGPARERAPGQALVEFALVSIFFVVLVVLLIEGARLVSTYFAMSDAAREGARAGAFVPDSTGTTASLTLATLDTSVRTAAKNRLEPWATVSDGQITICRHVSATATVGSSCDTSGLTRGSVIDVTVTYPFQFATLAGGWLSQTATITLTGYHRGIME